MNLSEKVSALAVSYATRQEPIIVRRQRFLFGVVPYTTFDNTLRIMDFGDYLRVMLSYKKGPFLGADFYKYDAHRVDTWAWEKRVGKWLPVWNDDKAAAILERIESSVDRAYKHHCECLSRPAFTRTLVP